MIAILLAHLLTAVQQLESVDVTQHMEDSNVQIVALAISNIPIAFLVVVTPMVDMEFHAISMAAATVRNNLMEKNVTGVARDTTIIHSVKSAIAIRQELLWPSKDVVQLRLENFASVKNA